MREGPDIARIAALIGDPARANMLTALMAGKALTAGELAFEAGIAAPTASGHLAKLSEGGLVIPRKQGRHRYFQLAGADVAAALEALTGLAAGQGALRTRTGPKDPALRHARVCYDHLAGEIAVAVFDAMAARNWLEIAPDQEGVGLTEAGIAGISAFGLDRAAISRPGRPLCRACLDWSERRSHMAGGLGAALLGRFQDLGWVRRVKDSRLVEVTPKGEAGFREGFGLKAL